MKIQPRFSSLSRRSKLLILLVPLLLGTACDPQGPGAAGTVSVSTAADSESGLTLEIRLVADDGKPFDPASADLSVQNRHQQASWNLAETEFPFSYMVGGGLGTTENEKWRVIAWVAKSSNAERPMPGEYYGTRVFDLDDCGLISSKYCGVISGIDLELGTARSGASSTTVDSESTPAEYIEDTYGSYSSRCAQGDGEAESIGTYVVTILMSGATITEVTGERDGTIQNCWMTNIDADESAEVLLVTRSAGSGGYADLHAYKFVDDQLQQMEIPEPDANLMEGYRGRDLYELTDGKLSRKFPIYLDDDSNCCPGGGDRELEFDSSSHTWKPLGAPASHTAAGVEPAA